MLFVISFTLHCKVTSYRRHGGTGKNVTAVMRYEQSALKKAVSYDTM